MSYIEIFCWVLYKSILLCNTFIGPFQSDLNISYLFIKISNIFLIQIMALQLYNEEVRDAKYVRRKDGEHLFNSITRRHDFVVFNVLQDCSVDTIKSYISDNSVEVLDIRRLSKEEWNNQSFCVTVLHVQEPTVSDTEFWPEDIEYRHFFEKRINQQSNGRNNTT